jgi:cytochrome b561
MLAPDAKLYATLRNWHSALAYTLFALVLLHLGAALMHALVYRDGVFQSMATLAPPRRKRREPAAPA